MWRRALRLAGLVAVLAAGQAATAAADVPAGMPRDVPPAATTPFPALPEPSATAWPFPSTFPQTSGTGRLDAGAELWSDFIYDDYGASSPQGYNTSSFSQSSGLAGRQGDYVFPPGPASNNGADIFRAGVGEKNGFSYWRVDWLTLADPSVPIAEWTFDTDNNPATGASAWPASAGVTSPGIDRALVVSSRGAWLVNPTTGARTDVAAHGGSLTVDRASKSFVVAIPNALLPVSGTWRIRLAAGLADAAGQSFAAPYVNQSSSSNQSATAERVYNITFRTVAQEPPVYTDGMSDALVAAAQAALAGTPLGTELGADGIARSVTGNFWMEDDQADTLAGGDVSKFSLALDWSQLAARSTTAPPQPTGYSARWYVSRLGNLGAGQRINDGTEGDLHPTLMERVQPYAVYVPTTYRPSHPAPLTWILHSLEVNYNQYGGLDPTLIQQLCQDRGSICATTEGFGPSGWYYDEAETDFWQVWRALAENFSLDPQRTVVSGYSMGGWAAYKLAFEHPDDYAGALVLDGPVICGIGAYPGVNVVSGGGRSECTNDGESYPFIANARWIPYVIDQTYADELVPTTGVVGQAQGFDALDERYQLFIHTGGDHLAFATEDRFGDVVAALGNPVRTTDPGAFTFSWYPNLDNAAFGIGTTGDYWLSGLAARDSSPGAISTVKAADAALPDPAVTAERSGTSLTSQPMPGSTSGLTWKLGARPAPRRAMTLTLTGVSRLSVDTAAARLPTGTVTVTSDGAARITFLRLPSGTRALRAGRLLATADPAGTAAVSLTPGASILVLSPPVAVMSCTRPTARLSGTALGLVRLGLPRAVVRRLFPSYSTRGRRNMDFFCPAHHGIRVGYRRGHAALILTSDPHFVLRGVRAGMRTGNPAVRRLRLGGGYRIGANTWYLVSAGPSRGVLKVRHGEVQEIGIALRGATAGRRAARRFMASFD